MSKSGQNYAARMGGFGFAAPASATLPPLDRYRAVTPDVTPTALRRIAAQRREGASWETIAKGLSLSRKTVTMAYHALPEELR